MFSRVLRALLNERIYRHASVVSATVNPLSIQLRLLEAWEGLRMRDRYSSRVSPLFQPAVSYFSQFVPSQSNHSGDLAPSNQKTGREARAGRSALVVDDVADVTEMLAVVLTHAGYIVVTAGSAPAALKAAQERQFDVIISDIGMPDMNGYQLAREVRQLPGYESTPMVAVTGYSMFDDKERSSKAGFNAHMTKPIDPRALLDLIDQL
jgi:two-component system, chemotaxis family, CheB/CheR fusion protein